MGRPQSAVHEGVEQYKRAALGLTLSAEREEGTRRGLHPQHTASNASSTLEFWPRFSQPGVILDEGSSRFEAGRGSETTNRFFARMLQGTCVGGRASARQGGAVEGGAANYNERIYIERTRA